MVLPVKPTFQYIEQSVNNVLMLKAFVDAVKPVWQALTGLASTELQKIRQLCSPENYEEVQHMVKDTLNDDVTFSRQAAELRNQRVYAIRVSLPVVVRIMRIDLARPESMTSLMSPDRHSKKLTLTCSSSAKSLEVCQNG